MRRILSILLIAALTFSLAACGLKSAIQDRTKEVLTGEGSAEASDSDDTQTADADFGDAQSDSPQSDGDAGASGERRPIASVNNPGGFWERLERTWEEAPEEGYVWTITIKGEETLAIPMGLGSVNYKLDLSCSHVGPDMLGVYKGSMAMEYDADLDAVIELLTLTGGSASYKADGWFENESFLMQAKAYDPETEASFVDMLEPESDLTPEEQAILDAYMGPMLEGVGSGSKPFETATPAGSWFDWNFRMTDGDMSGYLNMSNIVYGTTSGSGSVDASGQSMQGWATTSHPLVGTFSERYNETLECPFPYVIRLYETGEAVMELYSANGGPVTVKFYGTIDKFPVGETILMP